MNFQHYVFLEGGGFRDPSFAAWHLSFDESSGRPEADPSLLRGSAVWSSPGPVSLRP